MEARLESTPPVDEPQGSTSDKIVADLKAMIQRAEQKAKEQAKVADQVVRDHPYETIGIAFGLGLLIGLLARRK